MTEDNPNNTYFCADFDEFINSDNEAYAKLDALQLDFNESELDFQQINMLSNALQTKKLPADMQINLESNAIGVQGTSALAAAIQHANASPFLFMNLSNNHIGPGAAKHLAEALPKTHEFFELDLHENVIGDRGAEDFAKTLPQAPNNISLDLSQNGISSRGVYYLAQAIAKSPVGLRLDLSENGIDNQGAIYIANALATAANNLQLDLSRNAITGCGLKCLIMALQKGPDNLTLDIGHHTPTIDTLDNLYYAITKQSTRLQASDGDFIALCLADLLQKPGGLTLKNLTLNLCDLEMTDLGAKALLDAIDTGNVPAGFTLNLENNHISDFYLQQIDALLTKKEMMRIGLSCLSFHFSLLDKTSLASQLPNEMLCHIYSYVFPFNPNAPKKTTHFTNNVFNFFQELTDNKKRKLPAEEGYESEANAKRMKYSLLGGCAII